MIKHFKLWAPAMCLCACMNPIVDENNFDVGDKELNTYDENTGVIKKELSACSNDFIKKFKAKATDDAKKINLNCNLTLNGNETITKEVIITNSGVTLNCNGAKIEATHTDNLGTSMRIKSVKKDGVWKRPTNVTVKNCTIVGRTRVYGIGPTVHKNAELRESSHREGHTKRAQNAAPKNTTFNKVTFVAKGKGPLYLSPGVTYTTVANCTFKGNSDSIGVYLTPESGHNTFNNNRFDIKTKDDKPQLSVDGSAHNKIINNHFKGLNNGGIYLFRNCGEGGGVRHQTPSHNQIINNFFFYENYNGLNPAIYVGSRQGKQTGIGYCDDDEKWPIPGTSSKDNQDKARHNVIAQNQLRKRDPFGQNGYIYIKYNPNYVYFNERVTERKSRKAGCFKIQNDKPMFAAHGSYVGTRTNLQTGTKYMCDNGTFKETKTGNIQPMAFYASVEHGNEGTNYKVVCPNKRKIVGIRAACNLENPTMSDSVIDSLKWDTLKVVKETGDKSDYSVCSIHFPGGTTTVSEYFIAIGDSVSIRKGSASLAKAIGGGHTYFYAKCQEHDDNGGDCIIKGEFLCL